MSNVANISVQIQDSSLVGKIDDGNKLNGQIVSATHVSANIANAYCIIGKISNDQQNVNCLISDNGRITGNISLPKIIQNGDVQDYDGEYLVIPKAHRDQILPTKNKVLYADVTIKEIPTYETSNESGLTFIIGD